MADRNICAEGLQLPACPAETTWLTAVRAPRDYSSRHASGSNMADRQRSALVPCVPALRGGSVAGSLTLPERRRCPCSLSALPASRAKRSPARSIGLRPSPGAPPALGRSCCPAGAGTMARPPLGITSSRRPCHSTDPAPLPFVDRSTQLVLLHLQKPYPTGHPDGE